MKGGPVTHALPSIVEHQTQLDRADVDNYARGYAQSKPKQYCSAKSQHPKPATLAYEKHNGTGKVKGRELTVH